MVKVNGLSISSIQKAIKASVAEGDLLEAASLLWELAQTCDPSKEDEAIVMKCEISIFEKQQRTGILALDVETKERRRLAYRLLMISNSIRYVRKPRLSLES